MRSLTLTTQICAIFCAFLLFGCSDSTTDDPTPDTQVEPDTATTDTGGAACEAAGECDDGDDCTLEACEEGVCQYYASPIEGCEDTTIGGAECKESSECNKFAEGAATCMEAICNDDLLCELREAGDGTECDDGDACTSGEACAAGECVAPDGDVCDDGDACTTDTCGDDGCENIALDCDDGNACTDDDCGDEGCISTPNTADCDDGDICTEADACADGACGGTAKDCDDGDPCSADICDPETGECSSVAGAGCDDGNDCTVDSCDEAGECTNTPLSEGDCEDGDPCTEGDVCVEGACSAGEPKVCEDGDFCNGVETCDAESGDCVSSDAPDCNDGNACTVDSCDADTNACLSTALVCEDDENDCTTTGCNPVSGCVQNPNTENCDDNDLCTTGDVCADGSCGGSVIDCDDGVGCTLDSCDGDTGECENSLNDAACDDGDECTIDSCDTDSGDCVNLNTTGSCDDGDACTENDTCGTEGCAGSAKNCADSVFCTADSCDPATGNCVNTPDNSLCTDDFECTADTCDINTGGCSHAAIGDGTPCTGDLCTDNATCAGTTCLGSPKDCNDGNSCTADSCDTAVGCVNTPTPGLSCNDEDACTGADVCQTDGSCEGSPGDFCDDASVCEIAGSAGSTVDCPLMIARGGEFLNGPAGLQFVLNYDADSITFDTFYDESCFPDPIGCLDLAVAGPGAQTLSTGHTVSILPLSPVDWAGEGCSGAGTCADPAKACINGFCEGSKGQGAVVIVNLANPTALISDAYLDGGTIMGDPTFMEARFIIDADLGGGSVDLLISKITAAQQSSENMSATVQDGVIIVYP